MPANHWELRADARPLERAAATWAEMGRAMSQRADDIIDAARHALDGWDAAAAESYEHHRRQVIANLDQFTTLSGQLAASLRALSSMLAASQKELDQAWLNVSTVPHEVVGADRRLLFRAETDEDRALVTRCEAEAQGIRRRLTLALDQESTRLRNARAEFLIVRSSLVELAGGAFPGGVIVRAEESGVGIVGPVSTSVQGTAESGVSASLPPITPISVSMPNLTGIASAGLAPVIGAAASGTLGRRDSDSRSQAGGMPPMGGGTAAGAMRGGSAMGGAAGRRTGGGSGRLVAPRLSGAREDDADRIAREKAAAKEAASKEAAREAKRAAIAEKRAERAARKAEREAEKDGDRRDEALVDAAERGQERGQTTDAEPRPAHLTVVEVAPGEQARDARL